MLKLVLTVGVPSDDTLMSSRMSEMVIMSDLRRESPMSSAGGRDVLTA